jgi:DNA-binding NarL/FixJ family response regulator
MLESGGFQVMPCAHADEALEVLAAIPYVKAVVTDVKLSSGGMDGFELARQIRAHWGVGVIVISGRSAPDRTDLPSGMHFISKPVHRATLTHLVRSAVADLPGTPSLKTDLSQSPFPSSEPGAGRALTPRQHEVLALLVEGKSNREIAEALGLSENTVKVHLAAVFRALGVSSRTEALLAGMKRLSAGQHSPI